MKYLLLTINILMLSACGGGSDGGDSEVNNGSTGGNVESSFTLQNIRFDAIDYYEGEEISVKEGNDFEVQWVSPTSASYRIELYLSSNGAEHSDNNRVVALRCGSDTFSLCPNATGEVECVIDNNTLSCAIGNESVGSKSFLDAAFSNLSFIIKGCDALGNCDVKTFNFKIESDSTNTND